MRQNNMKKLLVIMIVVLGFTLFNSQIKAQNNKPIITFIELGSVNCIPCKKMQPIMKSLEKKYGDQIKIIFYDVWKDQHKDKAKKYGIKLIPTQVFQNDKGKEIHRHEGYYPEAEIDKFLQSKGLKIKG
jgi:thioredoxin 1